MHLLPEFDKDAFLGEDCSHLRRNIEMYDFDSMHLFQKSSWAQMDGFLVSDGGAALLLFYGDIKAARVSWLKTIGAWEKVGRLVIAGE